MSVYVCSCHRCGEYRYSKLRKTIVLLLYSIRGTRLHTWSRETIERSNGVKSPIKCINNKRDTKRFSRIELNGIGQNKSELSSLVPIFESTRFSALRGGFTNFKESAQFLLNSSHARC